MTYEWPNTFETEMFKAGLLTLPSINGACAEAKPEESFCGNILGVPRIYFDKGCGGTDIINEPCGKPLLYEENNIDNNLTTNYGNTLPQHKCDYWSGCSNAGVMTKEIFESNPGCNIKCDQAGSGFETTALKDTGCTADGKCNFDYAASPSTIDFTSWNESKKTKFITKCNSDTVEILPIGDCKGTECTESPKKDEVFCGDDKTTEAIGYKFDQMTLEPAACCDGTNDDGITFANGECVQGTICLDTPSPKIGSTKTSENTPIKCNDGIDNNCNGWFDRTSFECSEIKTNDGRLICGIGGTGNRVKCSAMDEIAGYGLKCINNDPISEDYGLCECEYEEGKEIVFENDVAHICVPSYEKMPLDGFIFKYEGLEGTSCSSLNCVLNSIDMSYQIEFSGDSYGSTNNQITIDYVDDELIFTALTSNTILVKLEKLN